MNGRCECVSPKTAERKFITGVPRGSYWVRVMDEYIKKVENTEELIEKYKLQTKPQDDDFVLIYGVKENVVGFLAEIGDIVREV